MLILHILLSAMVSFGFAQEMERDVETPRRSRVGEIAPEDQYKVQARVESLNLTTLAFGPAWASDVNNNNMYYSLHLGRHWEVNTNAEIRLNFDGAIASEGEGNWLAATVGAGWLISVEDISPVIGAEFGYGYTHVDGAPDPSGFVIGGFAGVRVFRTSSAQMSIEGFFQTILDEEGPVIGGVRLGILF